jgi:hypothetical protein
LGKSERLGNKAILFFQMNPNFGSEHIKASNWESIPQYCALAIRAPLECECTISITLYKFIWVGVLSVGSNHICSLASFKISSNDEEEKNTIPKVRGK